IFGVVDGGFTADRRHDGRLDAQVEIRRRLECLRAAQRNGRRTERRVVKIGLARLRAKLRRKRYQRRDTVKDRVAMTAPDLSGAQRELWRSDPEDRVATGAASEFFLSHCRVSGC